MTIHVGDVNEFGPEFEYKQYSLVVDESGALLTAFAAESAAQPEVDLAQEVASDASTGQQRKQRSPIELPLLTIRTLDADCSRQFSAVCRFELLPMLQQSANSQLHAQQLQTQPQQNADDFPIQIDSGGRVRLTRLPRASPQQQQSATPQQTPIVEQWAFQVVAYDCDGKKTHSPVRLNFAVARVCKPALKGKRAH